MFVVDVMENSLKNILFLKKKEGILKLLRTLYAGGWQLSKCQVFKWKPPVLSKCIFLGVVLFCCLIMPSDFMLCFTFYSNKLLVPGARQSMITANLLWNLSRIVVFDAFMNMEYLFLCMSKVLYAWCIFWVFLLAVVVAIDCLLHLYIKKAYIDLWGQKYRAKIIIFITFLVKQARGRILL